MAATTTAVLDGNDYVINGTKTFTSNGPTGGTFVGTTIVNVTLTITAPLPQITQVINAASGSIDATNGTLVFLNDLVNGGLVTNSAGIRIGAAGTGAITNSGTYVFAGGALAASVITNTGTAIGSGVDNANMVNSGFVTATNGELRLQGTASGAGIYRAVAGTSAATLTFAGGGSISTLLNTGTTIRVENSSLTNTSSFVNRGTLTLALAMLSAGYAILWVFGYRIAGLIAGVIVLDVGQQTMQISNQTRIFALSSTAKSRINTVYMIVFFLGGALGFQLPRLSRVPCRPSSIKRSPRRLRSATTGPQGGRDRVPALRLSLRHGPGVTCSSRPG